MKKFLVIINIILIVALCGGTYIFIKNREDSSKKISELENKIKVEKSGCEYVSSNTDWYSMIKK